MYGAQVPLVVFGVIALLAALLVTFMPETSRTRLPDTIQVSLYLLRTPEIMPCSRTGSTSAAGTACGPAAGDQGQTNAEAPAAVHYCDNIKWCDGTAVFTVSSSYK